MPEQLDALLSAVVEDLLFLHQVPNFFSFVDGVFEALGPDGAFVIGFCAEDQKIIIIIYNQGVLESRVAQRLQNLVFKLLILAEEVIRNFITTFDLRKLYSRLILLRVRLSIFDHQKTQIEINHIKPSEKFLKTAFARELFHVAAHDLVLKMHCVRLIILIL